MAPKPLLVVDDEPHMLKIVEKILKKRTDFPCVKYADPKGALESFRNEPTKYSVVVSDVKMPGLDGFGLFREFQEINESVPFVFITGGPLIQDEERRKIIDDFQIPVLYKPFDIDMFVKTIKKLAEDSMLAE